MSVSLFKRFNSCEVAGKYGSFKSSKAMLIGSYVDAFVEGTLEQFIADHPYVKPKDAEEGYINIFVASGELSADFKMAEDICKAIKEDDVFMQFMSGEKQTIMTGEIKGVPFKIKMDSYSKGVAINDLKVLATVTSSDGQYYDFISRWGYDTQLACYQEIVRQNTDEQLPCFICAVTKETPINKVIVNIPQVVLDRALYRVEERIERTWDIVNDKVAPIGCGVCETCISMRKETPLISMYDFNDFM